MSTSANNNVGSLLDSMCNLICSVEETRRKLNAARAMLDRASKHNDNVKRILERCTADLKLSEKLVQHVQTSVETMIETQAA